MRQKKRMNIRSRRFQINAVRNTLLNGKVTQTQKIPRNLLRTLRTTRTSCNSFGNRELCLVDINGKTRRRKGVQRRGFLRILIYLQLKNISGLSVAHLSQLAKMELTLPLKAGQLRPNFLYVLVKFLYHVLRFLILSARGG